MTIANLPQPPFASGAATVSSAAGQPVERLSSTAQIIAFLIIVCVAGALFNIALIQVGDIREPAAMPWTLAIMWTPALAALATRMASSRSVQGLGWRLGPARYLALAYAVTLVIASVPYLLALAAGEGSLTLRWWPTAAGNWGLPATPLTGLLMLMTVNVFFAMIAALGEELGWRGFLVPALNSHFGFWVMVSITWAVTLLFHLPAILGANYNSSATPVWFSLLCFSLMLMPLCAFMAWLRLRSGSVWPCVLAHAAHNVAIQEIWASAIEANDKTPWLVGEFGLLTPAVALVFVAAVLAFSASREATD